MVGPREKPKQRTMVNNLDAYPVGPDGGMLTHIPAWPYIGRDRPSDAERGIFWVPNVIFTEKLTLIHIFRKYSAAQFVWEDTKGYRWYMFMADVEEVMVFGAIVAGQASGQWQVRKRGQNYGLAMAPGDKPD